MALKLSFKRNRRSVQDGALGAPRAEIIKRFYEAIHFLEELRSDVPEQVRQSPARDESIDALQNASRELMRGASLLLPQRLAAVKKASA